MEEQSTYAQDISRIQEIVELLKSKDCDIDNMLSLVNEATALISKCQNKLTETGLKINQALDMLNAMKDA